MHTPIPATPCRNGIAATIATTTLVLLAGWATACSCSAPVENQAQEVDVPSESPSEVSREDTEKPELHLGDWQRYATVAAEDEWQEEPLDGPRWAQVSAKLACAGRSNRGDPDAHRQLVRNILSHHRTTLVAIASWSTRINQEEPQPAHSWAGPISAAVKGCH